MCHVMTSWGLSSDTERIVEQVAAKAGRESRDTRLFARLSANVGGESVQTRSGNFHSIETLVARSFVALLSLRAHRRQRACFVLVVASSTI